MCQSWVFWLCGPWIGSLELVGPEVAPKASKHSEHAQTVPEVMVNKIEVVEAQFECLEIQKQYYKIACQIQGCLFMVAPMAGNKGK